MTYPDKIYIGALSDRTLGLCNDEYAEEYELKDTVSQTGVEMDDAKELLRGAFDSDYDEEGLNNTPLWIKAVDELGIYPASVTVKGETITRTEFQNGWNEALIKLVHKINQYKASLTAPNPQPDHIPDGGKMVQQPVSAALMPECTTPDMYAHSPTLQAAYKWGFAQALAQAGGQWLPIDGYNLLGQAIDEAQKALNLSNNICKNRGMSVKVNGISPLHVAVLIEAAMAYKAAAPVATKEG